MLRRGSGGRGGGGWRLRARDTKSSGWWRGGSQSAPPALGPGWVLEGPPPLVSVSGGVSRAGAPRLDQSNPAQRERQHTRGFDGGSRPGAQRPHSDSVRVPGLFPGCLGKGLVLMPPQLLQGGGGFGDVCCTQKLAVLGRARRRGSSRGAVPNATDRCRRRRRRHPPPLSQPWYCGFLPLPPSAGHAPYRAR